MAMVVEDWSDLSDQPLGIEAIKALHQPNEDYLFRTSTYKAGASSLVGTSRKYVYALSGECAYWYVGDAEANAMSVRQGQRIWFPKAPMNFRVRPDAEFCYVVVLKLPEDLRGQGFR